MPIETTVAGKPSTVFAIADWLRGSLSTAIAETSGQVYTARNRVDAGWHGTAGAACRDTLTRAGRCGDELARDTNETARSIEHVAGTLQSTQQELQRIRAEAAAAGLTVTEHAILEPAPAPADPGPAPTGSAATPQANRAHADAVAATEAHSARVRAYRNAQADAESAHLRWHAASRDLARFADSVSTMLRKQWPTIGSASVGAGQTTKAYNYWLRRGWALDRAGREFQLAAQRGDTLTRRFAQSNPELARSMADDVSDLRTNGRTLAWSSKSLADDAFSVSNLRSVGTAAGGVVTVGAIAADIHSGESVTQAVASNGAGFATSVGAAMGTEALIMYGAGAFGLTVGAPVVVGAGVLVGVGVGVLASGAVDSYFEDEHFREQVHSFPQDAVAGGQRIVHDTSKTVGNTIDSGLDTARGAVNDVL